MTQLLNPILARDYARRAWSWARHNATTKRDRVPQDQAAAETLITELSSALCRLSDRAGSISQPVYVHNRLPDGYGLPDAYSGVYLRETYGIPERKDSAAKVLRYALILSGLARVTDRSGEDVPRSDALATFFDPQRAADGYILHLLPRSEV